MVELGKVGVKESFNKKLAMRWISGKDIGISQCGGMAGPEHLD